MTCKTRFCRIVGNKLAQKSVHNRYTISPQRDSVQPCTVQHVHVPVVTVVELDLSVHGQTYDIVVGLLGEGRKQIQNIQGKEISAHLGTFRNLIYTLFSANFDEYLPKKKLGAGANSPFKMHQWAINRRHHIFCAKTRPYRLQLPCRYQQPLRPNGFSRPQDNYCRSR